MMDRSRIVRTTSREVYKKLIEEGLLPPMRAKVYENLFHHGPMTRNEIAANIDMVPNDCSTRLRELRDARRVREVGEDICRVTGRMVILYDVTDELGQTPAPQRGRKRKEVTITSCSECPMLQEDYDEDPHRLGYFKSGGVRCWINKKVEPEEDRRAAGCPLDGTKFVLKGG